MKIRKKLREKRIKETEKEKPKKSQLSLESFSKESVIALRYDSGYEYERVFKQGRKDFF